jgi:hypothetical protein
MIAPLDCLILKRVGTQHPRRVYGSDHSHAAERGSYATRTASAFTIMGLLLAGCGTSTGDRVISGGGIWRCT